MALYLLSAPSGAGKTTFCLRLTAAARACGRSVAGVLSLPQYVDGRKTALWLAPLPMGMPRLLAHVAAPAEATWGKWRFLPAALAWGNASLMGIAAADLLIVDEIGPLELNRHRGLQGAFHALRSVNYRAAVVTVRPSLAERLAEALAPLNPKICSLGGGHSCSLDPCA